MTNSAISFGHVAPCVRHHVDAGNLKVSQLASWLGLVEDRRIYYWLGRDADSRKGVITSPAVATWVRNIKDPAVKLDVARSQFRDCGLVIGLADGELLPSCQIQRRALDVVTSAVDAVREIQRAMEDGSIDPDERPRITAVLASLRQQIDQMDASLGETRPPLKVVHG
jgi:hypothetical protein